MIPLKDRVSLLEMKFAEAIGEVKAVKSEVKAVRWTLASLWIPAFILLMKEFIK